MVTLVGGLSRNFWVVEQNSGWLGKLEVDGVDGVVGDFSTGER